MGKSAVQQGDAGACVAAEVRRLREERGWSLQRLSAALSAAGRPIIPSGVSKIEQGDRRVDVDDLVALATALDVRVLALLYPGLGDQADTYSPAVLEAAQRAAQAARAAVEQSDAFANLREQAAALAASVEQMVSKEDRHGER